MSDFFEVPKGHKIAKKPRKPKGKLRDAANVEEALAMLASRWADGRSTFSGAVMSTQTALTEKPELALKAILRHNISVNIALQNELLRHAKHKEGGIVTANGRLAPAVSSDLLKVQRAMALSVNILAKLETMPQGVLPVGEKKTVADILLDMDDEKSE